MKKSVIILFCLTFTGITFYGCSDDTSSITFTTEKIKGLAFSPYMDNQSPNSHTQISEQQSRDLLNKISLRTEWIRTFGCSDGLEKIPSIAKELGFKVAAGAWLSSDLAENEIQIANLIQAGQQGHVDIAVIGSEVLLRGDLTIPQLIVYINRVRAALPDVKITTADVYQKFLEHNEIVSAIDILFPHIYPYWEGISVDCAPYFINTVYNSLLTIANGKEIIIGETGWPSGGNSVGMAVPSLSNAEKYLLNFTSWAKSRNVGYMYFETFDENWKSAIEGPQGACWGIHYHSGGDLKPGMNRVFEGETVSNNWSIDTTVTLNDSPAVEFTFVPPIGSYENLKGRAKGVFPSQYKVAVFIFVNGWWNKPTFANPSTFLQCDNNKFDTDITTGQNDASASRIRAYLIPGNYNPPLVSGGSIPSSLQNDAIAWTEVVR